MYENDDCERNEVVQEDDGVLTLKEIVGFLLRNA